MSNPTVTRKDIARKAGVSVSVVSRALNNSGYVDKDKKKRIVRIAEEMGYHPNPVAVSLMKQRTKQLLFYCREIRNAFNIELYEGMMNAARKRNYLVVIHGSLDFKSIRSTMVDGIIFPSESAAGLYQETAGKNYHIPAVTASYGNAAIYPRRIPQIECDCWEGMELIFQYLRQRGHERIALAMPYGPETTEVRAAAWRESMRYELDEQELKDFYLGISKSGLPQDPRVLRFREEVESDVLYIPEDFFGKGMLAAEVFAERKLDATALICFNDEMALGFCKRYQQMGYRIPQDLSVIGYDGTFMRRYASPYLTALGMFPGKQGARCVDVLLDIIDGKKPRQKYRIRPRILEGESVKNLRR